jgi:hypothetical protein
MLGWGMRERIEGLIDELGRVTGETRAAFGSLSRGQLNWEPAADGWSIAQCLEHLIVINSLYFPLLASMRDGSVKRLLAVLGGLTDLTCRVRRVT